MLRTLGSRRLWAALLAFAIAGSAFAPSHGAFAGEAAAMEVGAPCAEDCGHSPHEDGACCAHAPGLATGGPTLLRLPAAGFAPAEARLPHTSVQEPPLRVPIA